MGITDEERSELIMLIGNLPEQERRWQATKDAADDAARIERRARQEVGDAKARIAVLSDKLQGKYRG